MSVDAREARTREAIPAASWQRGGAELEAAWRWEKAAYVFMGLLVVYVLVRGVVCASGKLLWFDELLTQVVAGQPTLHEVWKVMWRGFDVQPPLFYLIERAMMKLPLKREIALRLPSIVAFPCTLVCVFVYVKKRSGEAIACVCALLLLTTILFATYQTEARPYSMLVACMAFALVCYQRLGEAQDNTGTQSTRRERGEEKNAYAKADYGAGEPAELTVPASSALHSSGQAERVGQPGYWKWAALFTCSLLLAESLHHYALFAMIPFWLAEGMVVVTRRRVRWGVWAALLCGFLPLTYTLQLLMHSKEFNGPHYWALPDFTALRAYYSELLLLKEGVLGMAVAIVALAGVAWSLLSRRKEKKEESVGGMDWPEATLVAGFVVLPFIVYVLERIVHGTQVNRYFLVVLFGVALGIGAALTMAGRRAAVVLGVFLFAVVGLREMTFWRHPDFDRFEPYSSVTAKEQLQHLQEFVETKGQADLPIVTDDSLLYAQIVYYGHGSWRDRMVLMVDEEKEVRLLKTDTAGRIARALQEVFPLRLVEYAPMEQQHAEFLLFTSEMGWLYRSYMEEGAYLKMLGVDGHRWLVLVRPKAGNEKEK